jgi:hypothetical protein
MQTETTTSQNSEVESPTAEQPTVDFSPAYLSLLGSALLAACGGNEEGNNQQGNSPNGTAIKSDTASAANATGADISAVSQADTVSGYRPPGASTTNGVSSAAGFNNFPVAYTTNDAARFLLQSQFSASDAEIAAVKPRRLQLICNNNMPSPLGRPVCSG